MANINIDKLMEAASKGLGISKESLKNALERGDVTEITANMSESDRAKVNAVLKDPKLSEKFRKQYTEGAKKD